MGGELVLSSIAIRASVSSMSEKMYSSSELEFSLTEAEWEVEMAVEVGSLPAVAGDSSSESETTMATLLGLAATGLVICVAGARRMM
jgi:hypothetical protein